MTYYLINDREKRNGVSALGQGDNDSRKKEWEDWEVKELLYSL